MSSLRLLFPLLLAAGILLGGNGMQSTLIALRGASEGFSPTTIGLIGTSYFSGFLIGCIVVVRILRAVGHIRAFAALAAAASAGTLVMAILVDPTVWVVIRFLSGFCFAGLFTVIESWLNSSAANADRGRALAVYRIIDVSSVTGAQFLIPLLGPQGFAVFAVMSIMITLSLVPVSLGDRSNPQLPEEVKLDLPRAWRISPLGCIGCIAVGLANGAFRTVGPVYAEQIGLNVTDVVTFMSLGIIGSVLIQYPLGALSDRWDRRKVLLFTTAAALICSLAIALLPPSGRAQTFVLIFIFGAFAMPLFSLSAAHANDRAGKGEFVLVSAALMFFYSVGAIAGPITASFAMGWFGPPALFGFTAVVYIVFIAVTLQRIGARAPVPEGERSRFVTMLRTSFLFARLTRRSSRGSEAPRA